MVIFHSYVNVYQRVYSLYGWISWAYISWGYLHWMSIQFFFIHGNPIIPIPWLTRCFLGVPWLGDLEHRFQVAGDDIPRMMFTEDICPLKFNGLFTPTVANKSKNSLEYPIDQWVNSLPLSISCPIWLVGGYVSIYWEFHNPNWWSPSFFRGVGRKTTNR